MKYWFKKEEKKSWKRNQHVAKRKPTEKPQQKAQPPKKHAFCKALFVANQ